MSLLYKTNSGVPYSVLRWCGALFSAHGASHGTNNGAAQEEWEKGHRIDKFLLIFQKTGGELED